MQTNFFPADILLPKTGFEKWSVIACDQYTSEPEYWEETAKIVGNAPSALKIILPEAFLGSDNSARIAEINQTMRNYINSDLFHCIENSYILTRRTLKNGTIRNGIVGLIDLEDYSYETNADTLIRATERTVVERIPPRVEIRKDASLELPHIMLLIDDCEQTVIEPIVKMREQFEKLYDFNLMQNAGSVQGYRLSAKAGEALCSALCKLRNNAKGLLFAVGDGNHSLAAAKECYRTGKGPRYALAELVNIHDSSLEFEPIYRAVFGVDSQQLIRAFTEQMGGEYAGEDARVYTCIFAGQRRRIRLKPKAELAVSDLQDFLDSYSQKADGMRIDYIHGVHNLEKLCQNTDTTGFLFDGMKKQELFPAVRANGSLPRKTFSMGSADDKRFYLEAHRI